MVHDVQNHATKLNTLLHITQYQTVTNSEDKLLRCKVQYVLNTKISCSFVSSVISQI